MVDFDKLLEKFRAFKNLCSGNDLIKQGEIIDNLSEEDAKAFLRLALRTLGNNGL